MTIATDMEMYNVIEDSFLGKHLHEGFMVIMFNGDISDGKMHPFYEEVTKLPDYTLEQYEELVAKIKSLKVETEIIDNVISINSKYIYLILGESEEGKMQFSLGTAYNVWEIESKRLDSEDDALIERANKFHAALRK